MNKKHYKNKTKKLKGAGKGAGAGAFAGLARRALIRKSILPRGLNDPFLGQREYTYFDDNNTQHTYKPFYTENEEDKKNSYLSFKKADGSTFDILADVPYLVTTVNDNQLVVNMVVEIPKGRTEKFEMIPIFNEKTIGRFDQMERGKRIIAQDIKKGELRNVLENPLPGPFYDHDKLNLGPGYNIGSYGAICQTYEDSDKVYSVNDVIDRNKQIIPYENTVKGDGDPIDILLIHDDNISYNVGQIVRVHILGALEMIDEKEMDYKFIGVPYSPEKNIEMLQQQFENYNYKKLIDKKLKIKNHTQSEELISDKEYLPYQILEWFQRYKDKKNEFAEVLFGNLGNYILDPVKLRDILKTGHEHFNAKKKELNVKEVSSEVEQVSASEQKQINPNSRPEVGTLEHKKKDLSKLGVQGGRRTKKKKNKSTKKRSEKKSQKKKKNKSKK